MKIGIYGGSFDPVHRGHKRGAETFLEKAGLDLLYVIPDKIPPHKDLSREISDEKRFEMSKIAFGSISEKVKVSDIELRREGKSFSVLTVRDLKRQFPDDDLFLFVGTDMFLEFETWKDFEEIFSLVTLTCMPRDGETEEIFAKKEYFEKTYGAEILILNETPYIISSTEIRKELKEKGFSDHLPPEVNDFIELGFLYGTSGVSEKRNAIIDFISKSLPIDRVKHILSVERESAFLCEKLGLSDRETECVRLAALCHDITRNHTVEENLEIAGDVITETDLKFPMVLHGFSGAVLAKKLFGIPDTAFDAIRYHTTGKAEMNIYEKILWLADYTEEERKHASCKKMRARLRFLLEEKNAREAFDIAIAESMAESVNYLIRSEKAVHPLSLDALGDLRREVGKYGIE